MPGSLIDEVERFRTALYRLRADLCDMKHEGVRRDGERLIRRAICPARARISNIACSHTGARLPMRDAWLLLETIGDRDAVARREELDRIEYEISILDHRRYDAETVGRKDLIADCIARHRALAAEVEALRLATIAALDRAHGSLQLKIAS